MTRSRLGAPLLLAALALAMSACTGGDDPAYVRSIDDWHAARIERLQAEDGWLTLVGLHPLQAGENTVGAGADMDVRLDADVPALVGRITLGADGIGFTAADEVAVEIDGRPVRTATLASDASGEPTILRLGPVGFHVIVRGDRHFLRVKDNTSAVRRDFTTVERFAVDARWRVTARLETAGTPRTVEIVDVLGRSDAAPTPGTLVFELDGRTHRLTPLGAPDEPLFVVFGDATNGHDTYGGGRFLSTGAPANDGTVVLDFNRAYNPPCVFTPHATCPLPPPENRLPTAVTAGERMWGAPH